MRNKLVEFSYCYEIEILSNGSYTVDGEEILKPSIKFSNIVLEKCEEIAGVLFKSRFFILLNQDDRDKINDSFDCIASINMRLELEEEICEEDFNKEIIQISQQLLKLFDVINDKIDEINKELSK